MKRKLSCTSVRQKTKISPYSAQLRNEHCVRKAVNNEKNDKTKFSLDLDGVVLINKDLICQIANQASLYQSKDINACNHKERRVLADTTSSSET